MTNIRFKQRTGEDLLTYLGLSEISQDRANEQFLSEFCYVDDELLTMEKIAKLTDKAWLMLSSKLFASPKNYIKDDEKIVFTGLDDFERIEIERLAVDRKDITKMQTQLSRKNGNYTSIVVDFIMTLWDVKKSFLLESDYSILMALIEDVNFFLSELSKPENDFDVEFELFN